MTQTTNNTTLLDNTATTPFLPMRLFVFLRWIALLGQTATVVIIYFGFRFPLPWGVLIPILLISAILNTFFTFFGSKERLSAFQICLYLLYDLGQLTVMLFVTGGLNNPFILLLIVPVAISTGFLPKQQSVILIGFYVVAIFMLALTPYPLPWYEDGFTQPIELKIGIIIAMITTAAFTGYFMDRIAREFHKTAQALMATQLALGREQKIASLGALAAAAAHELGSPLSTILLAAKDLEQQDLPPDLREDVVLINDEVKRCCLILQDLSRNFSAEHQVPIPSLPLSAALMSVISRYPPVTQAMIEVKCDGEGTEPVVLLSPEWIHGMDNILQNACQFAQKRVLVKIQWQIGRIEIMIKDDGPGYAPNILPCLGEPYAQSAETVRLEKLHLGLGLFIARTLLAQWGAQLFFYNDNGACCLVVRES